MDSTKLVNELQNLVHQNLFSVYQKNTSKTSFNNIPHLKFIGQKYFFKAFRLSSSNFSQENKNIISCWRFPKTRLFYSEISALNFKVSVIEFFDEVIIFVQNYSPDQVLNITIEQDKNARSFVNILKNHRVRNYPLKIEANETIVICNLDQAIDKGFNISRHLSQLIEKEKSLHPLSFIQSEDLSFLREVDTLWTKLPWIGKAGELLFLYKEEDPFHKMAILFFRELYFLFGKSEKMQDYYKIQNNKEDFLNKCYNSLKLSKKKPENKQSFCDILLGSGHSSISIKNKVQESWDILSLPSRSLYFNDLIKEQPHEVAALIILVFKNNFWWKRNIARNFNNFLETQKSEFIVLWGLYYTLASNNFLYKGTSENVRFDLFDSTLHSNLIKFNNGTSSWAILRKGKNLFCSSANKNSPQISIDKAVSIDYLIDGSIIINPFLFQYVGSFDNYCLIKYGSIKIKIFLVWKDFTLKIGALRLKFLFKKNRYQVSIKGAKWINGCSIDGEDYSFENTLYFKKYKQVKKTVPKQQLMFFNNNGRVLQLSNITKAEAKVNIHGIVTNSYDQLVYSVSISLKNSRKNEQIDPLNYCPTPISLGDQFNVIIPKTTRVVYNIEYISTVLNQLKNSTAEELSQQMIVFLEAPDIYQKKMATLFFKHFGFFVTFMDYVYLNETFNKYNIIISEKHVGRELLQNNKSNEIFLKNIGQKKAISLKPREVESWLNEHFGTVL